MRYFLLYSVSLSLLLTGCKRLDHDTVCEGTVVDRTRNTRVAHATVCVYEMGSSGGGLGGGYKLKETHEADDMGNFSFQIHDEREGMMLRAFSKLGHETSWDEVLILRGGRNNKKLQLKVYPPAWVQFHVADQLPLTQPSSVSFGGIAPGNVFLYNAIDTTVTYRVRGDVNQLIKWRVNKVGGELSDQRMMTIPALDTMSFDITY